MAIEFKPSLKTYMRFAGKAVNEGEFLLCFHNISDALKTAETPEEKAAIWKCMSDMFNSCDMISVAKNALLRACTLMYKGGYYSFDFEKFFPSDVIYIDGEDEMESDIMLAYNEVYTLVTEGEYKDALDILFNLPRNDKYMNEIFSLLASILDEGKRIDFESYFVRFICIVKSDYVKTPEFLSLMVRGGDILRQIITETIDDIVDETEEPNMLECYGETFYRYGENEFAEKCFDRALDICDISEKALFYMGLIKHEKSEEKESKKYFSRYRLCYEMFGAPVNLIEEFIKSKEKNIYGVIPQSLLEPSMEIISEVVGKEISERNEREYVTALKNVLSYASRQTYEKVLRKISVNDNAVIIAMKDLLMSSYVADERKILILTDIMKTDYEGELFILFSYKGVMTSVVKSNIRGAKGFWNRVYREVSAAIIGHKGYIMYNPNLLLALIKHIAKQCSEEKIVPDNGDLTFIESIISIQYNRYYKEKINIGWCNLMPEPSGQELRDGLNKFPPEVISF